MSKAGGRKLCLTMVVALILTSMPAGYVYATTTREKLNQVQKENKETESQLSETKENLKDLKEVKNTLEDELENLNNHLAEVSYNLSEMEKLVQAKENEIAIITENLEKAKSTENNQYESMKQRIKFLYERSDYAMLETLLGADSWSEAVNKADYIKLIVEYDRKKLEEFEEIRMSVEEEENKLQREKEDLDKLKAEVEVEKKKVNSYIQETASRISSYSGQIFNAEAQALAYEAKIREQEANITYLKKKLAEEQSLSKLAAESKWRDISEVAFEESDRYLLANLIYCEAGGEPYAGQLAVGAVVMNRVLSSVYPNTIVEVIYQKSQFSPAASGRLALALSENKATASCYKAADEAMAGQTNVGNCVYFRTPIEGLTGISIGNHIFY